MKNLPCKYGLRFQLFCNYLNELQVIKGLPPLSLMDLHKTYDCYLAEKNMSWIDIFADPTQRVIIGFLLIGYPPNCHPDADFYIEEAYICPEFRRKGHMSLAVSEFLKSHIGTYCLFILNNNIAAREFWLKIFMNHGYVLLELRDVGAGDKYCRQYGFKKPSLKA